MYLNYDDAPDVASKKKRGTDRKTVEFKLEDKEEKNSFTIISMKYVQVLRS